VKGKIPKYAIKLLAGGCYLLIVKYWCIHLILFNILREEKILKYIEKIGGWSMRRSNGTIFPG